MAYAAVSQAEHGARLLDSPDWASQLRSPTRAEISSPPLSIQADQITGQAVLSETTPSRPSSARPESLLQSFSSSQSYQMVEGDDYDVPNPPRALGLNMMDVVSSQDDTGAFQSEDAPIRTASISRNLPLKHPTPDFQTLQGAFVKNVERLEESAERLSMTSSLEEELTKMKLDQKRLERQFSAPSAPSAWDTRVQRQFSTGSWHNSILGVNQTARIGGYSPSGYITSPTGSIQSGRWPQNQQFDRRPSKGGHDHPLPEPPLEPRPLDASASVRSGHEVSEPLSGSSQDDRPPTSASNETYHQAQAAFTDFDGAYYNTTGPSGRTGSISRHISLQQPPLARDAKAYREAQPGEKMIYYPAPVPVMLNLPQRLSKMNIGEREQRRLQGLSLVPDELRKSAPWLVDQDSSKVPDQRTSMKLPPQLRASTFFEQPSVTQDLQLKNGSATQTLDSILDAAAHAPVSAFTDHPIAGHVGKEVYGRNKSPRKSRQVEKKRQSSSTVINEKRTSTGLSLSKLRRRRSKDSRGQLDGNENASGDELDSPGEPSIAPGADEFSDDEESGEDVSAPGFSTAPTTLLAELQMRKEQQKQRNRTAADAFPQGMHSTLLELDAVTQLQQKARKTKHVTLAWEDHDEAARQNFDDEDIPLGVLFAEKDRADQFDSRPIGLIAKREIEDNEPLSQRRARLRGEPLQAARSEARSQVDGSSRAPFIAEVPGLSQTALPEQEDETLAQRAARIKSEKEDTRGQFTEEVTQELGLNAGSNAAPSKTPDGEETLGQRRIRLREEALRSGRQVSGGSTNANAQPPQLRSLHSMANILQAHPVGVQGRQVSGESYNPHDPSVAPRSSMVYPAAPTPAWSQAQQAGLFVNGAWANFYPNHIPYATGAFAGSTSAQYGAQYGAPPPMNMQQPTGGYPYNYGGQPFIQDPMMGPPLDNKQRAQIDRWRQSVVR